MIKLEAVNVTSDSINNPVHLIFRLLTVCCDHDWSTLLEGEFTLQLSSFAQWLGHRNWRRIEDICCLVNTGNMYCRLIWYERVKFLRVDLLPVNICRHDDGDLALLKLLEVIFTWARLLTG